MSDAYTRGDTMADAIALSSPSGRMSKRARQAAERRLAEKLFGDIGDLRGERAQPDARAILIQQAERLEDLARRGMNRRKFTKEAARIRIEAAQLEREN